MGLTWKSLIFFGDSDFDRSCGAPEKMGAWAKIGFARLHVKTCRLLDGPDLAELMAQLELIARWLDAIWQLNDSFELDLDTFSSEADVRLAEQVLRGQVPAQSLAQAPVEHVDSCEYYAQEIRRPFDGNSRGSLASVA